MKCPLITAGFWVERETSGYDAIDCLEEECAWWDKKDGVCIPMAIERDLKSIVSNLREIRDKEGG